MKTLRLKQVTADYIIINMKDNPCDVWIGIAEPEMKCSLVVVDGEILVNGFITNYHCFWILDTAPDPLELLEEIHREIGSARIFLNYDHLQKQWKAGCLRRDGFYGDNAELFQRHEDAVRWVHATAKTEYPLLDWRH